LSEYIDPISNYHWNGAEIELNHNNSYQLSLIRDDETVVTDLSAPEWPLIESPLVGASLQPDDQLEVVWDASQPTDYINIFLQGPCIENIYVWEKQDDGSYVLPPVTTNPANANNCTVKLEIRRISMGEVNSAFQGGVTKNKRIDQIDLSYEIQ